MILRYLVSKRTLLLCTVIVALPSTLRAQDSVGVVAGERGARVDSALRVFEREGFHGTVLVAVNDSVILEKGYGFANLERRVRNTPATLFEMNSITKTFTGAALLQLEARGRLRTSDSVVRYLGAFPAEKAGVTIDHLSSHRGGLVQAGTPLDPSSREAFIRDVKATPRESAPGAAYRYTNAGYSVLAAVVETVSGRRYENYVRDELFAPIGISDARLRTEVRATDARIAQGYVGSPGDVQPGPPNPYGWGTIGAGGFYTTVRDIYRWYVALQSDRVLPAAQKRKMFAPRPKPSERFGWQVDTTARGSTMIHKGGGSDDFASQILAFPGERIVIVWASNNLVRRWRQTLNGVLPALAMGEIPPSIPAP